MPAFGTVPSSTPCSRSGPVSCGAASAMPGTLTPSGERRMLAVRGPPPTQEDRLPRSLVVSWTEPGQVAPTVVASRRDLLLVRLAREPVAQRPAWVQVIHHVVVVELHLVRHD